MFWVSIFYLSTCLLVCLFNLPIFGFAYNLSMVNASREKWELVLISERAQTICFHIKFSMFFRRLSYLFFGFALRSFTRSRAHQLKPASFVSHTRNFGGQSRSDGRQSILAQVIKSSCYALYPQGNNSWRAGMLVRDPLIPNVQFLDEIAGYRPYRRSVMR